MSPLLIHTLQQLSYFGLFGILAGSAIVLPIPEELTLLTAGYFIATGLLSFYGAIPVALAGLLFGDCVLFFLARTGSSRIQRLRERINKIGLEKTWIFSPEHPLRAVALLRFITGFRFIAPLYAGFEQASWRSYLLVNGLVLVIFVPGIITLGWYFHSSIVAFIAAFEVIRHAVFIGILALAGVGFLPHLYSRASKHLRIK
jgi:membrane protein DedA with SNARE-associated domain